MPAKIPKQVLHQIISSLSRYDQGTLASCSLVSKTFNRVATPILWEWFTITPFSHEHIMETEDSIPQYNEDRFKYVKVAILETHDEKTCGSKAFDLPNLMTLRLVISKHHLGFRQLPHSIIATKNALKDNTCKLIENLKPKIIVFQETPDPSVYLKMGAINPSVWSSVETLIFIISPFGIPDHQIIIGTQTSDPLPKFKNLYIIYDPTTANEKLDISEQKFGEDDHSVLYTFLIKNPNCSITFVNSGVTNLRRPLRFREPIQDAQDSFWEDFMKGDFDEMEMEQREADSEEDHSGEINFITLEEFMEQEVCWRAFDPAELDKLVQVNRRIDQQIEDEKGKKGKKSLKKVVKNKEKTKVNKKK